jgi:hypothetical protein
MILDLRLTGPIVNPKPILSVQRDALAVEVSKIGNQNERYLA